MGVPRRNVTATLLPVVTCSASGRCLVDQNNAPFLVTGDSPQALLSGGTWLLQLAAFAAP